MQIIKEKITKSAMMLMIIMLCVAVMSVILFGVKQFQIGSQLASVNQVANLSHLLVRQQTNLFSILLVNNANTEKLVENLDSLTRENFVLDASLYGHNGELLAQSSHSLSLRHQLGLDETQTLSNQQIVEPIYSANGIVGFLRVTFDDKYGQTTQNKINHIFSRLYGELIIVFLAGIILASSVHYFLSHYRRARRAISEPIKITKSKLSSATMFHRRRRRM
ncbi:AhpA/YtjB family protein [Pasteurellaceae bacterium 22721_9_1]